MQELLEAITEFVANTPPNKVEQLMEMLKESSGPEDMSSTSRWATTQVAEERLGGLIYAWRAFEIPPLEFSGLLRGASYAYHSAKSEESVELVWTGPSSELVATRKTEQALLQVIQSARANLFLTTFVAYDVSSVMSALTDALTQDIAVSILLESSDQHGGDISIDAIGNMRKRLPDARIYFWGNREDSFAGGKVHAKVAVADEKSCFISSANLTGHAMEKNMEAGVLIKGGQIPSKLHRHLEALITTKQLKLV